MAYINGKEDFAVIINTGGSGSVSIDETALNEMLNEVMPIDPTFSVANDYGVVLHTYTFDEGMTWRDFVNSRYNRIYEEDGYIFLIDDHVMYLHNTESGSRYMEYVGKAELSHSTTNDLIERNTTYVAWT